MKFFKVLICATFLNIFLQIVRGELVEVAGAIMIFEASIIAMFLWRLEK